MSREDAAAAADWVLSAFLVLAVFFGVGELFDQWLAGRIPFRTDYERDGYKVVLGIIAGLAAYGKLVKFRLITWKG